MSKARQNTLTIPSVGDIYYNLSEKEQQQVRQFYGLEGIPTEIYADTIIKSNSKKDDTPKEFHPLLCTRCGGNLVFRNEFLICEYCGTMYSSDLSVSEKSQECYEPENKCATYEDRIITVYEFYKEEAYDQFCAIRKDGEVVATIWPGHEDISCLSECLGNAEVKQAEFSAYQILNHAGDKYKVPCLYIDI